MMEIITMFGTGDGGTDEGVASIDIPLDGEITAINLALSADLDLDTEVCQGFIAFGSSLAAAVNDTRSLIAVVLLRTGVAAGADNNANLHVTFNPGLKVAAGERIFMHIFASTGVTSEFYALIHLDAQGGTRTARRRM